MKKKIAISQPNYFPWIGYFHLMSAVDVFVFLDDVQYTKRDWRNRNRFKTQKGVEWLTIPVSKVAHNQQKLNEVSVAGDSWKQKHWTFFERNYRKAGYFAEFEVLFKQTYSEALVSSKLIDFTINSTLTVKDYLGIKSEIAYSSDFMTDKPASRSLAQICSSLGADVYVSAPAARAYLDEREFSSRGISVEWFCYANYSTYPQMWGTFIPNLSIVDQIMNVGPKAVDLFTMDGS